MLILQKPKICLVEIPNTDISNATQYMEENPLLSLQEEPYVPPSRNFVFRVRKEFVEKYLDPQTSFPMKELQKQDAISHTNAVLLKLELALMGLARAETNHVRLFCPKNYFWQRIKETENQNIKAHNFACIAFSTSLTGKERGLLCLDFIEHIQPLFRTGPEWFSPTNTFFLTGRIFMRKWIQSEWNNLRGLKHIMSHTYENDYFYKDYKPVSHKIHFLFAHEERRLCFSRILSLSSQSVLKHLYERTYSEHHYWKKALVITEMERRMK